MGRAKKKAKVPKKERRKSVSKPLEKNKTSLPAETPKGDKTGDAGRSQSTVGDVVGVGNVDKIRDILFGSQMRDYEKRFIRLEERIMKETADLRDETKKRFDSLENYINKEMESLSDRLTAEKDARSESVKELSKELKDTSKSFEKKVGRLDEQLRKSSRDLRQQILDQSKSLSDEIREKHEETAAALEQTAQELRAEKVDRATLSELFMEMAMRLSDEAAMNLNLKIDELQNE